MTRTHYIVRYSKRKLIPGRSLTFTRGEEVPASVNEFRVDDEEEALRAAKDHVFYDGTQATVTKVSRSGDRAPVSSSFSNNGYPSPEERMRLDISDVLDFVAILAEGKIETIEDAVSTAKALVEKHDGSCMAKGA